MPRVMARRCGPAIRRRAPFDRVCRMPTRCSTRRDVPHDDRWDASAAGLARHRSLPRGHARRDARRRSRARGDDARYFHELALRHEDMHGEALLMTLQTLGCAPPAGLEPPPRRRRGHGPRRRRRARRHPFDRELRRARRASASSSTTKRRPTTVELAPFAIARACVTEGEFAAFVDAGGYGRAELWSPAGRRWREGAGRSLPTAWRRTATGFEVRWFDRWRALAPAVAMQHVNACEAEAFCTWARPAPAHRSGMGNRRAARD